MARTDLQTLSDTVRGLIDAAARMLDDAPDKSQLAAVIKRGKFRPDEDEAIGYWFARFLSIRASLWPVIDDVRGYLGGTKSNNDEDLRYFLVGYAAVCVLVGMDRALLFDIARHSIVQRKLNEEFKELRIPRKRFTFLFESFVNEKDALALLDALKFAKKKRKQLLALGREPQLAYIVAKLPEIETALNPSKREFFRGSWAYVSHKWRRRGVVTANNVLAGVSEGVGRVASEIVLSEGKKVTDELRNAIGAFLEPGDILVTRHATALTNLFIPGFWPHAALYVGTPEQRDALGITLPADKSALWNADICTLEALKDGVRLRPLSDTLNVDFFAVLRPQVSREVVRQAIERGVKHEGKMYNFDFDFFSSDRLVCTEVIYRSYDGVGAIHFPLTERAGRKTLSAEDLLDFAVETDVFEPVALFGVDGCMSDIVYGGDVRQLLLASYRDNT